MTDPRPVIDFITNNKDEAAAIARRVAGHYRLRLDGHELVNEVVVRILARPDRTTTVENPAAYFTRACQHACIDLLRRREPGVVDDFDEFDAEHHPARPTTSSDTGAETLGRPDRFRSVVEHLVSDLLAAAGVLAWFVLASDPHITVDDVPHPRRGVAADRRLDWPALWFATRDRSLFASGAAVSRRRQRLLNRIDGQRAVVTDHLRSSDA